MKILIVSHIHTHPTTMGNSFAILAQVQMLQKLGAEVHLLYICNRGLRESNCQYEEILCKMQKFWGDKLHVIQVPKFFRLMENLRNVFYRIFLANHSSLYNRYYEPTTKFVLNLHRKHHFDACIVQYIFNTKLFDYVSFSKNAVFTHDVLAYKNLLVGENLQWYDAAQEARALQKCTDIFAIQEEEMHYFKVLSPQSYHYNVYTPYEYKPSPLALNKNIIFLSGNNIFNINGLKWFIEDVYPLIKCKHKDAKLLIAGGICNVIKGLYDSIEGIELKGYVDDPQSFYSLGDVAINPTYQGTGLKIKTFESIANDKVTLVHPHSMAGIFNKEKAPLFSFSQPEDWVTFLDDVWENKEKIIEIKRQNKSYIDSLNTFIYKEYKRFFDR